jgi:Tfp pilus assembly protein PilF
MKTRNVTLACAAALAMLSQTGCLFTRSSTQPSNAPEIPPLPASATVKQPRELPASEASPLCLRTAETLFKSGDDLQSAALFEKARAMGSRDPQISRRLAVLYGRNSEHARAREEFQKAIAARPNDADLYNDMGYIAYSQGKLTEAEELLRQAVKIDPKHKRAHVNLGLTLGMQGRYQEAFATFSAALPEAQVRANMAFIYTTQGKRDEAREAYRLALQIEPDMPLIRAALSKLEQPESPRGEGVKAARGTAASPAGR